MNRMSAWFRIGGVLDKLQLARIEVEHAFKLNRK